MSSPVRPRVQPLMRPLMRRFADSPFVRGGALLAALATSGVVEAADSHAQPGKFGVVAFVENATTGEVLQVAELAACH